MLVRGFTMLRPHSRKNLQQQRESGEQVCKEALRFQGEESVAEMAYHCHEEAVVYAAVRRLPHHLSVA